MAFDYWQKFIEDGIYHIYNKSVTGETMFRDDNDYNRFIAKYQRYFGAFFDTYAYALMPNHFHFLVKVRQLNAKTQLMIAKEGTKMAQLVISNHRAIHHFLIDQLRRWLSGHSLYFNRKYQRTGPLLMNKVKRVGCSSSEKVKDLICYIHHNAMHHGLRQDFGQWDYDSFNLYRDDQEGGVIARKEVIEWIGDYENFIKMHLEYRHSYLEEKI